ncbi:MAG: hypothetical protein GY805_35945, partial [Chloroflexi bacterium]|nr:hypothetical protein [Chloroflexota bacterium]
LRARTYNPSNGRFLQQDSVLGSPNQPRTLHRYAYSFNNPVNYTDPSGHMPGGNPPPPPVNNNNTGSLPDVLGDSPFLGINPDRSVNNNQWQAFGNDVDKLASQGWRPFICGIGGVVAHHLPNMLLQALNPFRSVVAIYALADKRIAIVNEAQHLYQEMLQIVLQKAEDHGIDLANSAMVGSVVGSVRQLKNWTADKFEQFDQWGTNLVGGAERWETIKLGVAWAAVGVASFFVPGALILFGGGTAVGAVIGIGKQLLYEGEFDTLEAVRMGFRGGIVGGLTGILGAGAATKTMGSALSG